MRRTRYITLTVAVAIGAATTARAQQVQLNQGNQLYQNGQYPQAASAYQQSLQLNPLYTPGLFNLGNALYQQKQYDSARKFLNAAAKNERTPQLRSAANYNIGNTYMREQKWQEAIDAYKQTLRENPQDVDAKYNLSYAQAMKKREEEEKNKNKKKQQPDKNKGNQPQPQKPDDNKNGNNDGNQPQPNKPGDDEGNQQQRPQPMPSKLSEQQAGQLLNALQQEEKKLQDKLQKGKGVPSSTGRDW